MSDIADEYEEYARPIIAEAKANYDLGKRLRTRPARVETVRVYTDEVAGARLGGIEPVFAANGAYLGERAWGIVKDLKEIKASVERTRDDVKRLQGIEDADFSEEIARLEAEIEDSQAKAEALAEEARKLAEKLEESAIDIELKSLPPVVRNNAKRKAKSELKIKGKVSADQQDDYDREHEAQLLTLAAVSLTDHAEGHKQTGIPIEEARQIRDFLPDSEYKRITDKLIELEFQASIAKSAVDDPDFSQAGS